VDKTVKAISMDNPELLEKILMYTGLAGLVVFGVFSLFKGIIQKNIFSSMNEKQSYGIIKLIIRGSLLVALVGIVAWGYTEIKKDEAYKNAALIAKRIKGKVVTFNGDPIANAKVALQKDESIFHVTDVNGDFSLEVSGTGNKTYDLLITHPQYQNIKKLAEVNFASTELNIDVGELRLKPTSNVEIPDTRPEERVGQNNTTGQNTSPASQQANITVYYDSEAHGCSLNVNINIGGKVYTPQQNPVQLLDVPLGPQAYSLSGMATCYAGSCNINGSMNINVQRDAVYYLVFDPSTCYATLLDEETYNTLKQIFY
jgi:hypothetical protein